MRLRQGVIVRGAGGTHWYIIGHPFALDDISQRLYVLHDVPGPGPRYRVVLGAGGGESGQAEQALEVAHHHSGAGLVEITRQMHRLYRATTADQHAPLVARSLVRRGVQHGDEPFDSGQRQL